MSNDVPFCDKNDCPKTVPISNVILALTDVELMNTDSYLSIMVNDALGSNGPNPWDSWVP